MGKELVKVADSGAVVGSGGPKGLATREGFLPQAYMPPEGGLQIYQSSVDTGGAALGDPRRTTEADKITLKLHTVVMRTAKQLVRKRGRGGDDNFCCDVYAVARPLLGQSLLDVAAGFLTQTGDVAVLKNWRGVPIGAGVKAGQISANLGASRRKIFSLDLDFQPRGARNRTTAVGMRRVDENDFGQKLTDPCYEHTLQMQLGHSPNTTKQEWVDLLQPSTIGWSDLAIEQVKRWTPDSLAAKLGIPKESFELRYVCGPFRRVSDTEPAGEIGVNGAGKKMSLTLLNEEIDCPRTAQRLLIQAVPGLAPKNQSSSNLLGSGKK